jgi:hypothetical protein
MMSKVSWPVVALSSNDRFLHVSRDAADLRSHIAADLADGFTVSTGPLLEFYDVGGRRLQPLVGPLWTVTGFEPTGDLAEEDELLRRMEKAMRCAERIDRQRTIEALVTEGMSLDEARKTATRERRRAARISGDLPEHAEHVLALLSPSPSDEAQAFNRGGWLHSAWHAAFG